MKQPRLFARRNTRAKLVSSLLGFIILLTIAATQTSPDTFQQIVPDTVEQAITDSAKTLQSAQPGLAEVEKVIDGDTIEVTYGGRKETVRFLGIDTPETHDPRKPVQCFGQAASDYNKSLLEGKSVRLEPDATNSDRDKYRRLLRYVYLPDGTLVNAKLIQDGYAFAYVVFPLERLDEFKALEQQARAENRGLWAGCNVNESDKVKQTSGAK